MNKSPGIGQLPFAGLSQLLGRTEAPPPAPTHGLEVWQMERDDAPLFRYLYRCHQPRRHLEFGTWQGFGTCLCLESCGATVWTLNLADGETKPDGSWAYGERIADESSAPPGAVRLNFGQDENGPRTYHRTDAGSYIGRLYREKGFGHRVCQIYCDSRQWSTEAYPAGFFDSGLVDGGHQPEVVICDTRKAVPLLRSGGLMLWHDYCPVPTVITAAVQGVTAAIEVLRPELEAQFSTLVWINPSHILLGIKK